MIPPLVLAMEGEALSPCFTMLPIELVTRIFTVAAASNSRDPSTRSSVARLATVSTFAHSAINALLYRAVTLDRSTTAMLLVRTIHGRPELGRLIMALYVCEDLSPARAIPLGYSLGAALEVIALCPQMRSLEAPASVFHFIDLIRKTPGTTTYLSIPKQISIICEGGVPISLEATHEVTHVRFAFRKSISLPEAFQFVCSAFSSTGSWSSLRSISVEWIYHCEEARSLCSSLHDYLKSQGAPDICVQSSTQDNA